MNTFDALAARGVSRRGFLKLMAATTAALGLPAAVSPKVTQAVETALEKPPVIWLHGMECTGCSESLLATLNPSAAEVVLDMLSIRYHETIMAASGYTAEEAYLEALKENFVLVVEGAIPSKEDRYCMVGGKPFRETVLEASKKAKAIIAVGSCATDGAGIPGACEVDAVGVRELLKQNNISTPVINLPCCPVKPATMLGTIVYYLTYGTVPPLDDQARPVVFYGKLLHDNCPRRGQFEAGNYLKDWNDPDQKDYCLILKGCKGPKTYTDCAQVWYNDNTNFCINAGSPCSGCSEAGFFKVFSPLYDKQEIFKLPGTGPINVDTAGKVIGGVAVAGVAVHLAATAATGRLGKKDHGHEEE
ncbi:hydrogenase small subunit [Dehalobacter sp. TeCB1]|uniref:hydrogenase small subunit n=1 Tax=Dehalobacter sp. TeCB1 TaxID=1843715 RepID=UPI00083A498F|nr:hydrogenase small subunit [Dehalobacter sp. TeCB1]OCZ53764.1 Ni,Fe-hydrogenase small subunit [Dehalobacter sp. TeCB1]